jgi:prenylated cyclic peptide (anacyclamide/piricyclamide family)
MKKNVMPKQAAPVERLSPATAGAEVVGVVPSIRYGGDGYTVPFAGEDAE